MDKDRTMIKIAYPFVLFAICLPFILRHLLPKASQKPTSAIKVPFFNELSHIFANRTDSSTDSSYLKYLAILIWSLLVISGSGIQWLGKPIALQQTGRDLMLAIDLSGSMQTPDMVRNGKTKTRIDVVKDVAGQFINKRGGDRLGLILFGTRAYLQTPLTFDRQTVSQMLDDATIGIAGPETAIGDAIGLAVKQMLSYPNLSKALVLLTDGGNNAGVLQPLQAAEIAKKAHIKIYTIGLGAKEMTIQTMFGKQVINPSDDLDIEGLKQIAKITGGKFFRAEDGDNLERIYSQINQLEPVSNDSITVRPTTPFYPWSLGIALMLSFILFFLKMRNS